MIVFLLATLFLSQLNAADIYGKGIGAFKPSTKQYDIEFLDGTSIPESIIYEIYDILNERTIMFDWQKGDVILIDNKKALHGRAPYSGSLPTLALMVQYIMKQLIMDIKSVSYTHLTLPTIYSV